MGFSNSLLVAMMFVMVLSIGLANILGGLSGLVTSRARGRRVHWIPFAWLMVLLFTHLDLFWHTLALLEVEEWRFTGFIYVVAGPVILFLASSLMLTVCGETTESLDPYFAVSRQFFIAVAALMVWLVGAEVMLGSGLALASVSSVAEFVLFLSLAASRSPRVHSFTTLAVCAVVLLVMVVRGFGLIA